MYYVPAIKYSAVVYSTTTITKKVNYKNFSWFNNLKKIKYFNETIFPFW
jgi:hypothetical protein